MPSSEICHRVALLRTDVSEEYIVSIIMVKRINELGTVLAVTSNPIRRFLQEPQGVTSSSILLVTYLILPTTIWPGSHLASNRNEHLKSSWDVKRSWLVRPIMSPTIVSRFSRIYVSLDVSRPYAPQYFIRLTLLLPSPAIPKNSLSNRNSICEHIV
jgi:hypothetical protein